VTAEETNQTSLEGVERKIFSLLLHFAEPYSGTFLAMSSADGFSFTLPSLQLSIWRWLKALAC